MVWPFSIELGCSDKSPRLCREPGEVSNLFMPAPTGVPAPLPASDAEAFAARTTGLGVGIGELEAAGDQLTGVIQHGSLQVECAPAVHHDGHVIKAHDDVAAFRFGHELQLVGKAVASPSGDGNAQVIAAG